MLDKKAFANAARAADALSGEWGLDQWMIRNDVDADALLWVSEQRALRGALLHDGIDPRSLPQNKPTPVSLSDEATKLMPLLQAAVMDGIAIGITAKGRDFGQGKKMKG